MNSLSWFLYAADVLGNVRAIFIPITAMGFAASVILTICGTFLKGGEHSYRTKEQNKHHVAIFESNRRSCVYAAKIIAPVTVLGIFLCVAIPSQNTLYAIAASEAGERVVKSEAVQGIATDASRALQSWITKQIEPEAKP